MLSLDRDGQTGSSLIPDPTRPAFFLKVVFFLLGVGLLIPWNAFISAKAYFEHRLCNSDDHNSLSKNFESMFGIGYYCSSVLTLGLLIGFQWMSDNREKPSSATENMASTTRESMVVRNNRSYSDGNGHSFFLVVVPLSIYFVVLSFQAAAVWWVDLEQMVFYYWTVGSLALCGLCGALASSGIVAVAGLFLSEISTEPFLAGQSAGGLGVACANLVAAIFEDPNDFWNSNCRDDATDSPSTDENATSTHSLFLMDSDYCSPYARTDLAVSCYFILGSTVLAACIVGYCFIDRVPHGRNDYEIVQDHGISNPIQENSGTLQNLIPNPRQENSGGLQNMKRSSHGVEMNPTALQQPQPDGEREEKEEASDMLDSLNHLNLNAETRTLAEDVVNTNTFLVSDSKQDFENMTAEVFRVVKSPAICIFVVFLVTLALFPGWYSKLRSIHQCANKLNRVSNDLFTPIAFVVFNAGDLSGRIASGYLPLSKLQQKPSILVLVSLARFVFFPLMFLCASQGDYHKAWTIHSDAYSWSVQLFFGFSNGFIVSTAFVLSPSLLPDTMHVQERSAEILTFALYVGLLGGSLFSVPISSFFSS